MKLKINCCDGVYNSFDVHFTSLCDNQCKHCVDMRFNGLEIKRPDASAIVKTIINNAAGVDDVLFLGGEPCLFMEELYKCLLFLKKQTNLKLFVTTAIPKTCYDEYDLFKKIIAISDGINLSVQHNNEKIADKIRQTVSKYDRQAFYKSLPYKDKIRLNLNLVKPYLHTKKQIMDCLKHYDAMGFNSIKLSEIQHGKDFYTSFEKVFKMNLGSPYSKGCQKYIDIYGIKTPILLKRSCFACEDTLNPSLLDGFKVLSKFVYKPSNKYGVIYGNGELKHNWL